MQESDLTEESIVVKQVAIPNPLHDEKKILWQVQHEDVPAVFRGETAGEALEKFALFLKRDGQDFPNADTLEDDE